MKTLDLKASGTALSLVLVAFVVTACNPPHPRAKAPLKVISTLDCPESEGDLNRKSAAADGKSCVYAGDDGAEVSLTLVSLGGQDPRAALEPIETRLKAEVPTVVAGATPKPGDTPLAGSKTGDAVEKSGDEKVDIDLPGLHIHTNGDRHAHVGVAGVHVDAHDGDAHDSGRATVRVGGDGEGVNINASDGGAQIRINERGSGVRARFMLASDTAGPHGYKVVGYEARGPKEGPLVVGALMTKSGDHDGVQHDIHKLLERNVGG
jgi:hypothetical protein